MTNEEELNEQQSLELITNMINKAKCDYEETGIGTLIWGSLVAFCSLITFGNFYWKIDALNYIWFLTLIAVIPQIVISIIMYGIPTFATGYINHFKPMIIGGIVFWLFATICFYIQFPFIMLFTAAAAIIAWLIPGLILRRRYIKAKQQNV